MSKTDANPPEYREDDTWFSDDQLSKLTPADQADLVHAPIPTQMVSNGEYLPLPQSANQKRVEARLDELAESASARLGMSRRRFLATTGGTAASFLASRAARTMPYAAAMPIAGAPRTTIALMASATSVGVRSST